MTTKERRFEGAAQENRKQSIKNYNRVTISTLLSPQSLCVAYERILKKEIKENCHRDLGDDDDAQSFVEVTERILSYGQTKTIINRMFVSDFSPFWNVHKYKLILNNNVVNWTSRSVFMSFVFLTLHESMLVDEVYYIQ